jgi:hypothetical protein
MIDSVVLVVVLVVVAVVGRDELVVVRAVSVVVVELAGEVVVSDVSPMQSLHPELTTEESETQDISSVGMTFAGPSPPL